jgi:sulfur carrier protein
MRVQVNGEPRDVASGTTVSLLLQQLGVERGPVAVERNREIVPRALHESTALHEGDELEVVQFVGGG